MDALAMDGDTEKLTQWLMSQPNLMATVSTAAAAMEWPDAKLRSVVEDSYWLFLHTFDGVQHVLADGE